jgi:hypothetical protein
MKKIISLGVAAAVASALLLSGCGREEASEAPTAAADTAATGTPTEQPGAESTADTSPVNAQTWIDDVTIGADVGADGSIPADKVGDDFAPGQPVHVAMEVADAPENAAVKVIWFGPNETKVGEETKTVTSGQKYLDFAATDTKQWKKGDYRAEVWVGDEKVNEQQFNVTDASKAANLGEKSDRG